MMELLVSKFKEFSSLSSTGQPSIHVHSLPYILELIAVMERVLAFCYTGSARVLVKDLMQPMWTTLSLKAYTTPILNPDIVQVNFGASFRLAKSSWPVTAANTAAMASQRALSLTYSEYLADVSSVSSSYLLRFSAIDALLVLRSHIPIHPHHVGFPHYSFQQVQGNTKHVSGSEHSVCGC
jgi:hypothetical protein